MPDNGWIARRIWLDLSYWRIDDFKGGNPEEMHHRLGVLRQRHIDRCVLYVFRYAVYYAESATPDAELHKWWKWKDKKERSATNRGHLL
jgi:hypothetical protein